MKVDRVKELEKVADRLGIGRDRDIECVGCQNTFRLKDAIILSQNDESKYLCNDCYKKVLDGKLKEDNNEDLLRKFIEIQRDRGGRQLPKLPTSPDEPPVQIEPIIWETEIGDRKVNYSIDYGMGDDRTSFMAMIPNGTFTGNNKN